MALVVCSNPLGRALKSSLVEKATELARKDIAHAIVCDWISIYRACFDMNEPDIDWDMWTKYVNELESSLLTFIDRGEIAKRRILFSSISRPRGGTGRRNGLKIRRPSKVMGVQVPPGPLD